MLMASFYLNHLCKGPITKHSHILREIHMSRLQHEFQRDTAQPVTAAIFRPWLAAQDYDHYTCHPAPIQAPRFSLT